MILNDLISTIGFYVHLEPIILRIIVALLIIVLGFILSQVFAKYIIKLLIKLPAEQKQYRRCSDKCFGKACKSFNYWT